MKIVFKPETTLIKKEKGFAQADEIEAEPMVYGGSWEWCRNNAGKLTNEVMDCIEQDVRDLLGDQALKGYHPVIDTKSVLLMPGQYPCIPGWHCDGVIRKVQGYQPNMDTVGEEVFHFICTIGESDSVKGTELITNEIIINNVDEKNVWKSVDKELSHYSGITTESGQIVRFNRQTIHRGSKAEVRGWRFFFRLSFYHMPAMNKLRNQVQVYTDINQGW